VQHPDCAALSRSGRERENASTERAKSVFDDSHDVSEVGWHCPAPMRKDRSAAALQTSDPPGTLAK
jgi:hypothetical protein